MNVCVCAPVYTMVLRLYFIFFFSFSKSYRLRLFLLWISFFFIRLNCEYIIRTIPMWLLSIDFDKVENENTKKKAFSFWHWEGYIDNEIIFWMMELTFCWNYFEMVLFVCRLVAWCFKCFFVLFSSFCYFGIVYRPLNNVYLKRSNFLHSHNNSS